MRISMVWGVVAIVAASGLSIASAHPSRQPVTTAMAAESTEGTSQLDDIEAIKQLKARYFRAIDTKDWDGLRHVLADDVVVDTTGSAGPVIAGADAFVTFLRTTLGDAVTVHQGHMPEITPTSGTSANGIWALEDLIRWPTGTEMHGYGHYHEVYEKIGDAWKIKKSTLTRLRTDITPLPTL